MGLSNLSATASKAPTLTSAIEDFDSFAEELYQSIDDKELNFAAFEKGLRGYVKLQSEGQIKDEQLTYGD